ncbi:DUF1801 domain-containing protein [Flagellimonas aequoris]|uniref:DUF1801 domain-containing protein n=1 Tax=Flagellimonas aequoris TaxID=2306997 RepID=A0A418N4W4_9FLAO|nr:DUF1801 domain-containing protein [Allomuricauda aequoris]RIV68865.1 DUF1801 domain-containing protein [Allomuricauda aequoris]TXK00567.1 DUF1801 domain-containing protein [Allomuricauda aequoris]
MNQEVTEFLDGLNHPLRTEIEHLRTLILNAEDRLTENVKWNGPNYSIDDADRITMKIHPPKQIQLIFHRGAKKLEQPKAPMISSRSKLLVWKGNDRAIASFKNLDDIGKGKTELMEIVKSWIQATS